MTTEPYQVMPALDDDQLHALRQSIKQHGILQPIEVDQDGAILDGHHRARIADELGIDCPQRVVPTLDTDDEKRQYALTVNVARRHLTPAARAELVGMLRLRGLSVREIAKQTGLSKTTVARDLDQVSQVGHLPDKVTGADGKTYAATRPQPATQPDDECEQSRTDAEPDAGTCEACGGAVADWSTGFLRCDECDSEGEHVSLDGPGGPCRKCTEAAADPTACAGCHRSPTNDSCPKWGGPACDPDVICVHCGGAKGDHCAGCEECTCTCDPTEGVGEQYQTDPEQRIKDVQAAAPEFVRPTTPETPARRDSDPNPGAAVATTGGPATTPTRPATTPKPVDPLDDPQQVARDAHQRASERVGAALVWLHGSSLRTDPAGWLADTWQADAYPFRHMPRVGDAFTTAGLRDIAAGLLELAEHLEQTGASL